MDHSQLHFFDARIEKAKSSLSISSNEPSRRRNWWLIKPTAPKDLLVNANGRYECPREYCRKTYKEASSLQRHIRCVEVFFVVVFANHTQTLTHTSPMIL